jgi:hypothetical protein
LLPAEVEASERRETHSAAVRLQDAAVARAVDRAFREAFASLGRPDCREVFSDFRAASGRPLASALAATGLDAREFLSSLFFYDGSGYPGCAKRGAFAFTRPGSRVVFVCGQAFLKADPLEARAVLIHEMLHALGLVNEAPGSNGITRTVLRRCR